jgi:hypothetical protein
MTGHQQIIDGGPRQNGGKGQSSRRHDRKILQTVDGKIDLPTEQCLLELLSEETRTLGGRFVERHCSPSIAGGGDSLELNGKTWMGFF